LDDDAVDDDAVSIAATPPRDAGANPAVGDVTSKSLLFFGAVA
jgi:hypothetical protein